MGRGRVVATGSAVLAVLLAAGSAGGGTRRALVSTQVAVAPAADAYVTASLPSANFGGSTRLRVDSSPAERSYLRFDVTDVSDPILSASLQVVPTVSLGAGVAAHGAADGAWVEGAITYDNAPVVDPTTAGVSGPVTAGSPASIDVSSAVAGEDSGFLDLALVALSSTELPLKSRETDTPPVLLLTVERAAGLPSDTAPPRVSDQQGHAQPLPGDQLAADAGTWTNGASVAYAWQTCTPDLARCAPLASGTQVVTVPDSAVGSVIRVQVTATNAAGSETAASGPTATVAAQDLGHDPVVMAAGDIACGVQSTGAACAQGATSDVLLAQHPDLVLPLGDNQYECGSAGDYQTQYAPTWGRLKSISRPVAGNHEYTTSTNPANQCFDAPTGAPGYYGYFGSLASPLDVGCTVFCKGYYSYDVGAWHLIALNSNCTRVGNCSTGDPQVTWLQNDLAAHAGQCILAYFHHPRWTSGQELDSAFMGTIYSLLYAAHVDVILNGHDHDYERFAPLDPNGDVDPANGIREFVVGTGGRNLTTFVGLHPGSEVRRSDTFGLLRLVLHPTSYRWQFVPAAGGTFADSGSQPCHIAAGADHTPPSPPPALRATAVLSNRIDLAWQPASDDVGVVAYRIYRNGSPLTTVGNIHGFADTGAQPGTPYTYTVSALDASGNESAQSPVASVTTPAAEATPPLFVDGFETGTLDQWTDTAGNVQPSTSAASGKYAARLVANGAPTLAYRQFSPAVDDLWLRARFEVASQSTQADLFRLRTFGAKAGQSFGVLTLFVTPAGRLGYRIEPTGATVVSQTTVATGVWHTLLLHVHLGDLPSAGAVDTTLDGSPVPELTGPAAVQSPAIGRVQIGSSVPAQTFDASFDDVVASTVQP